MPRCTIGFLATLALALLVAPLAADAQPPAKIYRIGVLSVGPPMENRQWPSGDTDFLEELRTLGYVAGHNLLFEPYYAETREQLPALAAELVRRPRWTSSSPMVHPQRGRPRPWASPSLAPLPGDRGDPLSLSGYVLRKDKNGLTPLARRLCLMMYDTKEHHN